MADPDPDPTPCSYCEGRGSVPCLPCRGEVGRSWCKECEGDGVYPCTECSGGGLADLTLKEKLMLNKIYRAVHDGVCPKSGGVMTSRDYPPHGKTCACGFEVTASEMTRMSTVIAEWGEGPVAFFERWRKG